MIFVNIKLLPLTLHVKYLLRNNFKNSERLNLKLIYIIGLIFMLI